MLDPLLSRRGGTTVASIDRPWRFAPRGDYDADTNPKGLVSFGTAENVRFNGQELLYRGSSPASTDFPDALANHLNEYLEPHSPIRPDQIECSDSATAMHDTLAWALANSGDAFLTSRPVYGRFEIDFFNKAGVRVEYADTTADGCFDESVIDKFEETLADCTRRGVSIKAVFIVNPHNPLGTYAGRHGITGRCYPRGTLVALLDFCQKHRLHLISDEIYACSVFDSGEPDVVPFTSILSIDVDRHIDPRLLHVTYGLSKDFGAAGLRLGAVITRSESVLKAVRSVARFHNTSGPSLVIGTAMLRDDEWRRNFIRGSRAKIAAAYKHVSDGLRDMGIDYLPGSNAGFFIWIDLSPYLSPREQFPEFALAAKLKDAGVFLHPKEEHCLKPGWFRLVYTQDPRTITEGLMRNNSE
ncbi:Aspartate/methionine/tyrosine aminotransferase [Geosmithia morbida]|uniref:Aspartate/methionine/tyrosine aminotransferase n=1 Tax=Geosmithia morbida TaxID=1094350 RepID=A0A9P5D669_9HYPO|nr:Aspartate/methionine/tyrosine aminotransferase [Geosmithia morbida]KAF4124475.1 Aspartate/methionine/tyrosine aminotransferase [Geosmithia morbida]